MALLEHPYWNAIDTKLRDLLRHIGQSKFASRFYLAGGTALALQIGHRRSIDLDFFSESDQVHLDTQQEISIALHSLNPIVQEQAFGNYVLPIESVSVGFFSYGYPLIKEMLQVENIWLASLPDIGLMKIDAFVDQVGRIGNARFGF